MKTVVPAVIKPLHSLWNEVIGFLFLAFAVLSLRSIWHGYHEWQNGADFLTKFKFLLTLFFFLIMLGFGLHAFWKARKISRS